MKPILQQGRIGYLFLFTLICLSISIYLLITEKTLATILTTIVLLITSIVFYIQLLKRDKDE